MHDDLFADAAQQLLRDQCTPHVARAIEDGGSPEALWSHLEEAGFVDALIPEARGGAGLGLAQVFGVWGLCGAYALPLPLAQTMVARAVLAGAGVDRPAGAIALGEGRLTSDGSIHCTSVALGRIAELILVQHTGGWQLLPRSTAQLEDAAFGLDASMRWQPAEVEAAAVLPVELPVGLDMRTLLACIMAAQLAGALMAVFERTLQYANERSQFGRPIGKFQAIQHQLAVMSEHVFAARMAAQLGCMGEREDSTWPDLLRVAVAKARCSQAAVAVAEAGHAIHGAIGFTAEYDLQLFTRRLHAWRQAGGSESYWHGIAGAALVEARESSTLDLLRSTTDVTV